MILKNRPQIADFFHTFGDLFQFGEKIEQLAATAGINLADFCIDHLALRVNQMETAQQWRSLLLQHGTMLKESNVNGRPIALITLNQPVDFLGRKVSLIELPFPKGKIYPQEGWEHIELVYPMQPAESVEQWIARTQADFGLAHNRALALKISQTKVEGERLPNPSIAVSCAVQAEHNVCIKIHPYPLDEVVR